MSICPNCDNEMVETVTGLTADPRRRSEDHILPRERGGKKKLYGDTKNIRVMCQACNSLLASCFHCIGAVAAVRTVAEDQNDSIKEVLRIWGFGKLVEEARGVILHKKAEKKRAQKYPSLGRLWAPGEVTDYIFPADTAAKRVWNIATMAKYSGASA